MMSTLAVSVFVSRRTVTRLTLGTRMTEKGIKTALLLVSKQAAVLLL